MAPEFPVENLLRGISDERVRAAFARVDRARFVPESLRDRAWDDRPLPIEEDATISQPSLVAQMTEWLQIGPGDRVLEIGTGSGYQTALLAELATEVATVEFSRRLAASARKRLEKLGYTDIRFRIGDGRKGWPEHAPYDRILATVAFPERPDRLLEQLSPNGGIALIPVGPSSETQSLIRYRKSDAGIAEERRLPVRFLSLR